MYNFNFTTLKDEQLLELIFIGEDKLDFNWSQEMIRRPNLLPYLAQIVIDKNNWLADLPEWWAVVHSTYLIGYHGGQETILPLLSAMRWADAFDCDWVIEVLPSIFGWIGQIMIPGLITVINDYSAGWSARDIALKGLAAITIKYPKCSNQIFQIIGERLMDDQEQQIVRQLAGQILLDFRVHQYRMALLRLSREERIFYNQDMWYHAIFDTNDIEIAFRQNKSNTWYYQEDWMRFYLPSEIQRRQKRWGRERLDSTKNGRDRISTLTATSGNRLLTLTRTTKSNETNKKKPFPSPPPPNADPEKTD